MKRLIVLFIIMLSFVCASNAQLREEWFGTWGGTMYIYSAGALKDSVVVAFVARPLGEKGTYTWRMEYHSIKRPMVKDYTLRTRDAAKGLFVTDEGEGVELSTYLVGDKLYSLFEVQGVMLTASYELKGPELIFEVTSGKKEQMTGEGVSTYSVTNLQRVVLKKQPNSGR